MKTIVTALLLSAATMLPAQAQFALDSRFADEDGDLIADVPTDEGEHVDPDTLIFTYTPVEDPAVYADVWQGFMDHLAEATGKDVEFFPVQSNAAQLEAMRAGRLHIAGFNTGSNPIAVACAGFRPFAMMAANDGSFGYEMEIIVPAGSDAQEIEDLRGGEIAFTQETSNSGFKAPSAILSSEFDMVANEDFTPAFSGSHDTSILGVANGDYEAAAIANSVMTRMVEREVVDADQIRSIYQSATFPTTGYGTVYNLTPDLQEQIREAFFSFDWEGSTLAEEFNASGEEQFIEISFEEDWEVIRQIDDANGVSYTCQ
ncbi:phosphate/phosphite/phosphonate ABC transporter substrate-binding protein [Pararhizobium haloflavum]|uniref:phosphate/phosphite/phosphonate ABC transporter substrate-binding protein n=1 Tax=Pararhizobium haloflavum TaxID=2037914 RepID=UPI000C184696|nr:phosphate/phosphite/phosphonate ABC transporter substrate-binding protein [Pararhizobium haloflavum]